MNPSDDVNVSDKAQLGTSSDITACRRHLNRHMSPGQACAGSAPLGDLYTSLPRHQQMEKRLTKYGESICCY